MRYVTFLIAIALAFAADPPAKERLVGTWKLLSYDLQNSSGAVIQPQGREPVGRIIYDDGGRMAVQITHAEPVRFASMDPRQATSQETEAAFRGYTAYFGRYSVDEKAGQVIHHVEASLFPNLVGTDVKRQFRFEADRLVLEGKAAAGQVKLVWQRVR